jgi:tetratricopeptide (TPR) repeat protein
MLTDSKQMISPDVEAYQAMKVLENGDTQAAISACHEAIAKFGPNRNLYLVKARAHLELEEYGFAEEALLALLSLDPEHPAAWAMLGEAYYRLGKTPKVDYCRARLENIFPALAEYLNQPDEDGKEVDPTAAGEQSLTEETIVPLEDLAISPPESSGPEKTAETPNTSNLVPDINGTNAEIVLPTQLAVESELRIFETATFAEICSNQGKYEKAMEIYEKLLKQLPDNPVYLEKIKIIKAKIGTR